MQIGKSRHEVELSKTLEGLRSDGWKVVNLKGKSPDAVATRDGELIAIEVLGMVKVAKHTYEHSWTYKGKRQLYEHLGFDELKIFTFER
jgi:Holliday junction resolvase